MFCGKCGAKNSDNAGFCGKCGARIKEDGVVNNNKGHSGIQSNNFNSSAGPKVAPALNNMTKNLIGGISLVLLGIVAVIYLSAAVKGFEGNRDAFYWVSDEFQTSGYFLHWVICAIFVIDVIRCFLKAASSGMKGKYLVQTSLSLIGTTGIVWICGKVWDDYELEDLSIVLYRVFGTYRECTPIAFIILIIAFICGILCFKTEQE